MANKRGKPQGDAAKQEVLARETELVKLRRGGFPWDLIADRTGYASPASARQAYKRALTRVIAEDVAEIRTLETERLDIAQSAIWGKVLQGDNASITNLLRIMERRAKLLGLDVPVRQQVEVINYDATSIESELARIYAATLTQPTNSFKALEVGGDSGSPESTAA